MEKIIFRKFLADLLTFFFIVSLSLSLITWIIQSVNYLDFISKDGHGFKVYFSYISLNFPKIFSRLMIFSYFLSLFYIIQKYQSNNEILIFWTNGISKIKFINFIIKISVIFTIIQIILVYFLVPKFQDEARNFIRTSNVDLFSSLITEKKFIDTVKDFTIFVEKIDNQGNMKNIFLKDSANEFSAQIISAKSGKIITKGSEKYLNLNFGQILDIANEDFNNTKVIKFNNTTFNLSNFKTKSTTFPKLQELESKILIDCSINYLFGNKTRYALKKFECSENSSIKGSKELFNRSIKQLYIIILGMLASLLFFANITSSNYFKNKILIFSSGIMFIIFAEISSEFLNLSVLNNIIFILFPVLLFLLTYLFIVNLSRKEI